MRVSNSYAAISPKISFKTKQNYSNLNTSSSSTTVCDEGNIVKLGLIGLAIIGAAATGKAVLKHKGLTPAKLIKDTGSKIYEKFSNKPPVDPAIKALKGKRDAKALELYNSIQAKKKITSLHDKILSGYFDGKPNKVFNYIRRNERALQRQIIHNGYNY